MSVEGTEQAARRAVDKFWEAIPFVWGHIRMHIRQEADELYGITVEQFQILRRINAGHDTVSKLAETRQISRAAASRVVDVLVNKGQVARAHNPADRREIYLSLTEEGARLMHSLYGETRSWMVSHLEGLDEDALDNISGALDLLQRAFEKINQER